MLKLFSNLKSRDRRAPQTGNGPGGSDPFAHPAIARMTQAELGDLPLGRVRYDRGR